MAWLGGGGLLLAGLLVIRRTAATARRRTILAGALAVASVILIGLGPKAHGPRPGTSVPPTPDAVHNMLSHLSVARAGSAGNKASGRTLANRTTVVAPAPGPAANCRAGDPLANVYHPARLHVLAACKTVSGTVTEVRREPDWDIHMNIELDPQYASLVNAANVAYEHGALVAEIVPADAPGCTPGEPPRPAHGTYDYGTCTGADLSAPAIGEHITITGPYVLDTAHGWMEIHPVWSVVRS